VSTLHRQKPLPGAHVSPTHPHARGLRNAFALTEGSGSVTFDLVAAVQAAMSYVTTPPVWETSAEGNRVMRLASGSTQVLNAGDLSWMAGATAFTMIARIRRDTSASGVKIYKGNSFGARVGLQLAGDGLAYFTVGAGGGGGNDAFGTASSAGTNATTLALVFTGAGAANADRCFGYVEGVVQTLSFFAGRNIPAALSTNTDPLYLGFEAVAGGSGYSDGTIEYLYLYDRDLTAAEVQSVTLDPYAMLRPLEIPLPGAPPAPITVTFSNPLPAAGATRTNLSGANSIDIAPTNVLNPIDTVTATYNGLALPVTLGSLGSGAYEASVVGAERAGATNTVVWTATTADANPNTRTVAHTARRPLPATQAEGDTYAAPGRRGDAVADVVAQAHARTAVAATAAVLPVGFASRTEATAEFAAVELGRGLLSTTAGLADVLVTEFTRQAFLPVSVLVGERHANPLPVSTPITAITHEPFGLSALVAATLHATGVPMSVNAAIAATAQLLALSVLTAERHAGHLDVSASVEEVRARLALELFVVSQALQGVENE
jgi:hypothetical protein